MSAEKSEGWLTVNEYARAHQTSTQNVYKKLQRNTLQSRVIDGVKYVKEVDDMPIVPPAGNTSTELSISQQYALARLQLIRADTELKLQKVSSQKEAMKREICEAVYTAYSEAFADYKSELIALHLSPEQLAVLNQSMSKALTNFNSKLKEYLKKQDEPEEELLDEKALPDK